MAEPYTNPYDVLGLAPTATIDEIKAAYFAQVRQHPPERDPEAFKRIRRAYEQLRTPEKRVEADMRLLQAWPGSTRTPRIPEFDLVVHREDALTLFQADTDLARVDFRDAFRVVRP